MFTMKRGPGARDVHLGERDSGLNPETRTIRLPSVTGKKVVDGKVLPKT
jgi:hypothetical protein